MEVLSGRHIVLASGALGGFDFTESSPCHALVAYVMSGSSISPPLFIFFFYFFISFVFQR